MGRSPGTGLSRRIINGKRRDRAHHKKHSGPLWNLDKLQDRVDRWCVQQGCIPCYGWGGGTPPPSSPEGGGRGEGN